MGILENGSANPEVCITNISQEMLPLTAIMTSVFFSVDGDMMQIIITIINKKKLL